MITDLFAGPGGLDVAAEELGVPSTGIEWDAGACATRRAAGLDTVEGDVRAYGPSDFPGATILAGGPPCQTFTIAGTGAGRRALDDVLCLVADMAARRDVAGSLAGLDDVRTGLVVEPLRWALEAIDAGRPYEAVVLEQVPAVLPVWQAVGDVLTREGYSTVCGVLAAEEFGVPQTRRRAVLIARRHSTASLPVPTHRPYRKGVPREAGDPRLAPWVTMGDALDRGHDWSVVSNYGTGGDPKNRGRRTSSEPAFTVTGKISRNRIVGADGVDLPRLTAAEAGRLQSFPAGFPWSGRDVPQQVGNAIPPRLGVHLLVAAGIPVPAPAVEGVAA